MTFFKQYNDNYGHQQGDECIIAIADELKKMEDGQTFCARYGGDEFIIIYAGISAEEVHAKAGALRQNIMDLKLGAFVFQSIANRDNLPGYFVWSSGGRKQELGFSTYCRYAVISGKEEKQK